MSGAGDIGVLVEMARAMADALRRRRGERRLSDWLGWYDIADLCREARRS